MRLRTFLPSLVASAAAVVFSVFFLDVAVEKALEQGGTAANGAKVEIDDVDIGIRGCSLTIRGLQVTDKEEPMTNALEVGSIKLDLEGKALFWRRLIVEHGEITGIKTGTPRKKSGAIPVRKKEKPADAEAKEEAEAPAPAAEPSLDMSSMKEKYDPSKLQAEDLASYNKAREEQASFAEETKDWPARVEAVKSDQSLADARKFLERVKATSYSGAEGAKKAAADLKEAGRIGGALKTVQKEVSSLKTELSGEVAKANSAIKAIDALKDKDVEAAMSHLAAAGFSAEGLAEKAVGAVWLKRAKTAIGWIKTARELMPPRRKKEEKPEKPSRNGMDVPFEFRHRWPGFHLKLAELSGVFGTVSPIECEGTLKDVTSDPKLVGRPAELRIAGAKAGGPSLRLNAVVDHTKATPREEIEFDYLGMSLAGMKLGQVRGPVALGGGSGTVRSRISALGSNLAGTVNFTGDPVRIEHSLTPEQAANVALRIVNSTLKNMTRLDVKVLVSGKVEKPAFRFSSSLEKELKGAVDRVLKAELDAMRARYRARIDELVSGEKKKLTDRIAAQSSGALGKLGVKEKSLRDVQAEIEKARKSLVTKSAGSALKSAPGKVGGLLKR